MKKFVKAILIIITVLSAISSVAVVCGAIYLQEYSKSKVDGELLQSNEKSCQTLFYRYEFADRGGRIGEAKLIEDVYLDNGVKYQFVSYDKIPEKLVQAFISIEDKRFSQHSGIDYLRSIKAVANYILGGNSTFGGSTITQQLVKNLTGNDGFNVQRKLSEAFAAMDIEREYDKTQILEMYLNVINLSEGCRGVGAASQYFYSKEPMELSLDECATIAAITNNPSKYNPAKHPEENKSRRDLVLRCMLDQEYISQEEYDNSISAPISLNISKTSDSRHVNSWYIDMVVKDVIDGLCQKYGMSRENASLMLYRGGYKIYTAMDTDIQNVLDEYYSNAYNFPIDSNGELAQSSMIVIDPYTCDILGVAGAVGRKEGNRVQSYATDTKRPSGSAIKPLSVYAPALEGGTINWSTIISDSPLTEATEGSRAWPSNANNIYVGDVTVKYAIENSLNTVAVKTLRTVGNRASFDFLRNKLRIKSLDAKLDTGDASLALGQHSRGITLRELTAAYSVFSEGMMGNARSYFKVTDSNGRVILDNTLDQQQVISRENAAIMTKLMQTVVESGTARGKVSLTEICEVAGKTGTTQDNCDRYFVGYTPELLAGVWFGYEYPKSLNEFGGNFAVTVWDEVMNKIYSEINRVNIKNKFSIPESVQKLTYNSKTGSTVEYDSPDVELEDGWFDVRHK